MARDEMASEELQSASEFELTAGRRAPSRDRRTPSTPDLSLVIPTYNEAANLPILVDEVVSVLADIDYEIIIVDDDSPDGTSDVASELSRSYDRVSAIRRTGERGLSSAVMLGMSVGRGKALAVMDADLQHDPSILPAMVELVLQPPDGTTSASDVVVASREVEGGSYGNFASSRRRLSAIGAAMARLFTSTSVSDPMSGFFVVSRSHFEAVSSKVNPRGFKILLEFLARGPRPKVAEVGYRFRERRHGETKLTSSVAFSYLISLAGLATGRMLSAMLAAYLLVGGIGVLLRYSTAWLAITAGLPAAALIGFEVSVVSNYWMNNRFTFSAERHRGLRTIPGFASFHLVAMHGLIVQAAVVAMATGGPVSLAEGPWRYQIPGILLATAGNYALNRSVTWRRPSH